MPEKRFLCLRCKNVAIRGSARRCRACMRPRHWVEVRFLASGWSVETLAKLAGVSTASVMRALAGRRVSRATRDAIADLLKLEYADRLAWELEHEPDA